MSTTAFEKKNETIKFILTNVLQDRDSPSLWGFEIFAGELWRLARFTFNSEREATLAATSFAWVMDRIAVISLSPSNLVQSASGGDPMSAQTTPALTA